MIRVAWPCASRRSDLHPRAGNASKRTNGPGFSPFGLYSGQTSYLVLDCLKRRVVGSLRMGAYRRACLPI